MSNKRLVSRVKNFAVPSKRKSSCPFGKKCFSENSVCGLIGLYEDCPTSFDIETIRNLMRE